MQAGCNLVQVAKTGWQACDGLVVLIELIDLRHRLIQNIFNLLEPCLIAILRDVHDLALGVFN